MTVKIINNLSLILKVKHYLLTLMSLKFLPHHMVGLSFKSYTLSRARALIIPDLVYGHVKTEEEGRKETHFIYGYMASDIW